MNYFYKISLIGILFYYTFSVIHENYQNNFALPTTEVQPVLEEESNTDRADKFSIKKTLDTGLGVHDRIRYKGDWN